MNMAIIENDGVTATYLKETLEDLGHDVIGCFSECQNFLAFTKNNSIDLVFMEIAVDGSMDGIRCALKLQKEYKLPSIFITSFQDKNTINDAMEASPLGYLIKPVGESEIKSALELASEKLGMTKSGSKILSVGDYVFNQEYKILTYKEESIDLTKDEFRTVGILFKSSGKTVPVHKIVNHVWKDEYPKGHSLKEVICRLRDKLPELNIMYSSSIGYSVE